MTTTSPRVGHITIQCKYHMEVVNVSQFKDKQKTNDDPQPADPAIDPQVMPIFIWSKLDDKPTTMD